MDDIFNNINIFSIRGPKSFTSSKNGQYKVVHNFSKTDKTEAHTESHQTWSVIDMNNQKRLYYSEFTSNISNEANRSCFNCPLKWWNKRVTRKYLYRIVFVEIKRKPDVNLDSEQVFSSILVYFISKSNTGFTGNFLPDVSVIFTAKIFNHWSPHSFYVYFLQKFSFQS